MSQLQTANGKNNDSHKEKSKLSTALLSPFGCKRAAEERCTQLLELRDTNLLGSRLAAELENHQPYSFARPGKVESFLAQSLGVTKNIWVRNLSMNKERRMIKAGKLCTLQPFGY